jgi:hypothetical protein
MADHPVWLGVVLGLPIFAITLLIGTPPSLSNATFGGVVMFLFGIFASLVTRRGRRLRRLRRERNRP